MTSNFEQPGGAKSPAQNPSHRRQAHVHEISDRRELHQSTRPVAFVVAGMHRSGTSALARTLSLCGIELPRTLMAGNAFNEDGYWESEVVKTSNDALLQEMDSAWDDALALRSNRASKTSRKAIETVKATIQDQFPLDRDVIIKDPRISLLFPLWREALDELGFDLKLIVPVRHPLEVAASMTRRDGFPAVKSALLWLTYFLSIERDSRDTPRTFLSYDDLLSDWRSCLRRVERLSPMPRWNDVAELEIDKFLSTGRRHHQYELEAFRLRSDIPEWVGEAYRWALSAARDEEPSPTLLASIAKKFVATADVYAPLVTFERRKSERQSAVVENDSQNTASLYFATTGESYSEGASVHQQFRLLSSPTIIELTTPPTTKPISAIRIDPAERAGQLRLHGMCVRTSDGLTLWQWDRSIAFFDGAFGIKAHAAADGKTLLEFTNNDPQFELPTEVIGAHLAPITVEIAVSRADESDLSLIRTVAHTAKIGLLGEQIDTLASEQRRDAHNRQKQLDLAIQNAGERAAAAVRRDLLPDLARAVDTASHANLAAANAARDLKADLSLLSNRVAAQKEHLEQILAAQKAALDVQTKAIERELAAQRSAFDAQTRAFEQQRSDSRQRQSSLEREEKLEGDLSHTKWQARRWEEEATALRSSTSWKITAPLRALTPRSLVAGAKSIARMMRDGLLRALRGPVRPLQAVSPANVAIDTKLLATSQLFDPLWYLKEYQDVATAGIDPLDHYLNFGAFEGRNPGPDFNSRWYLTKNPDVQAAGVNPLVHFLRAGRREKRKPMAPAQRRSVSDHFKLFGTLRHYKYAFSTVLLSLDFLMPVNFKRKLRRWRRAHAPPPPTTELKVVNGGALFNQLFASAVSRGDEYVPLVSAGAAPSSRVRAIAFYLPQFHPIPENDMWWGKGFTEWTNVSKAVPQFVGHYQPRIPDELGFYDLRVIDVQRRQVELAKQFGLSGFCFHYYWFSGRKRLLERPLNQYLSAKDIDFPFCVCWANENWTRRWDGLDQQVLMEQRHEPDDDLSFIEDLAPVLRDERYIRINGRPLLIVYRAGILPRPQQTLLVWREYCRANGIGEIYVVAAQTFGLEDPRVFGFDAAVEFPPHKISTGEIQSQFDALNPEYEGRVFSYEDVARTESHVVWPEYKLFKTVMPSWDNEARKPGKGHVFFGSSPEVYRDWLEATCRATDERHVGDEKLVFVNAWNEWAEGAYLEPDRRYGYAYLEATRLALAAFPAPVAKRSSPLFVIAHAYYPEVFAEILDYLKHAPTDLRVIATCPADRAEAARQAFDASGLTCAFELIIVENRGRDVFAFLEALRQSSIPSDAIILKVHTKVTGHRLDGSDWRKAMLDSLMLPGVMSRALDACASDPRLGLIAPAGYIVPLRTYIGENQPHIDALLRRGMWAPIEPETDVFAAGTMFYIRRSSLDPILKLPLDASVFEDESGQKDGTVAHALERLFTIAILREGGAISDTGALMEGRNWRINDNFDFAVKTPYLYQE